MVGGLTFDDELEEQLQLQQMMTVTEYMTQFESLLNEVVGQIEGSLISFYIGGFKLEIKFELKIVHPMTLRKALATTKVYEANKGGKTIKEGHYGGKNSEFLIKTLSDGSSAVPIFQ